MEKREKFNNEFLVRKEKNKKRKLSEGRGEKI